MTTMTMVSCGFHNSHDALSRRFPAAFRHKRGWGKELTAFLEGTKFINLLESIEGGSTTFTELYTALYSMRIRGLGRLLLYDIATQICRDNGISEERIYLLGNGPRKAAKLLRVPIETARFKGCILPYTTITHVLHAFDSVGHDVPISLRNSKNGDDFESYLCKWSI